MQAQETEKAMLPVELCAAPLSAGATDVLRVSQPPRRVKMLGCRHIIFSPRNVVFHFPKAHFSAQMYETLPSVAFQEQRHVKTARRPSAQRPSSYHVPCAYKYRPFTEFLPFDILPETVISSSEANTLDSFGCLFLGLR